MAGPRTRDRDAPVLPSQRLAASFRGGDGFFHSSSSSSPAPSESPAKRTRLALPVGVPRPPTARSSRSSRTSTASGPTSSTRTSTRTSTRASTLTATQPRSSASSQEPSAGDTPRPNKRSTTPSPSPPPEADSFRPTKRRSTTSAPQDPPPASFRLPPPSQPSRKRKPTSSAPSERRLGPVPQLPPSCFQPAVLAQPAPSTSTALPAAASASTPKRPRPRAQPATPPAPRIPAALARTDFAALDPAGAYGLRASLLFRCEYLAGGAPTYEQGGRRAYGAGAGAAAAKGKGRGVTQHAWEVPRWAKTEGRSEWEEDVLRRLGGRLVAPTTAAAGEDLVPLLFAKDLDRLRLTRLGDAGGIECYLLGREWPVRAAVWTGWVVGAEFRERENAWVYAVDDGTAVLEVVCPAPASSGGAVTSLVTRTAHLPQLTSSTALSPRKALAAAQFAHLESRVAQQSGSVVAAQGECVRIVGTVEERRNAWEEGRRVVASRMDILTDVNAVPAHHRLVAVLHRTVYSAAFDARARLAAIERAEAEAWDAASAASSSVAGGSEWGGRAGGSSVASSPAGGMRYRPTRPSKLAPEDFTLSNFLIYIRHHLVTRYTRLLAPSSPGADAAGEESVPFTLPALQRNRHLATFAVRLAQERARAQRAKSKLGSGSGPRAWVAHPAQEAAPHRPARGAVRQGAARLLLPPPSGRARPAQQAVKEEAVLEGEELERAVGRVWREAIRTMRRNGMVVEAEVEDPVVHPVPVRVKAEELPDLPRRAPAQPETPPRAAGAAPWGGVVLPPETPTAGERTPRAAAAPTTPKGAYGCPWGDVRLYGDEDDAAAGPATPRAPEQRRVVSRTPAPAPAPAPAAGSPARSDTSIRTSGSLAPGGEDGDADAQAFQLVTAGTLAPLVLALLSASYASGRSAGSASVSVTEKEVRLRMHAGDRWSAVARYSDAVGRALGLLAAEGRVEKHGAGWRPVQGARRW